MAFRRQRLPGQQPFLTGSGTGRSIRSARLPAQTPEPGSAPGADLPSGAGQRGRMSRARRDLLEYSPFPE